MEKHTVEESIGKIRKLGKILRSSVGHEHKLTKQEEKAVSEAIRIHSMHRDKFVKEQKKANTKERKHEL